MSVRFSSLVLEEGNFYVIIKLRRNDYSSLYAQGTDGVLRLFLQKINTDNLNTLKLNTICDR